MVLFCGVIGCGLIFLRLLRKCGLPAIGDVLEDDDDRGYDRAVDTDSPLTEGFYPDWNPEETPDMSGGNTVCVLGHKNCLGPNVAANQGGCRMQTWGDVG
jgi:hypothetical protein